MPDRPAKPAPPPAGSSRGIGGWSCGAALVAQPRQFDAKAVRARPMRPSLHPRQPWEAIMKPVALFIILTAAACAAPARAAEPGPPARAVRAQGAIRLDGRLDEPDWAASPM